MRRKLWPCSRRLISRSSAPVLLGASDDDDDDDHHHHHDDDDDDGAHSVRACQLRGALLV
eukprot:COSAG01_NODE_7386_length_3228_cov_2.367732_4_plen_60_part_00